MTKEQTVNGLKRVTNLVVKDLEALPEEAITKSFGPKVRTVADIVYEVITVNDDVVRNCNGEACAEWPEGWLKAPAGLNTKAAIIEAYTSSAEAAIQAFEKADLSEKVVSEMGESDKAERCRFLTLHNWYHLGQINFIQTLFGDDDWHW